VATSTKAFLTRLGLYGIDRRLKQRFGVAKYALSHPPYGAELQTRVQHSIDVVRYGALALALSRIERDGIPGELAEVGVFRGEVSRFVTAALPGRPLHLFDTFAGFPDEDFESAREASDHRFTDTSVAAVRASLGSAAASVRFHPGHFPTTADQLGDERFAFVSLDVDKRRPTLAGLDFFYPRLNPGGYVFIHDYNSPESDYGVSKAVDAFFADRPEFVVELPDRGGSVVVRKAR
jgi:O-methyltransferase